MNDFTLSLDLVAALLTVCYLARLVFQSISQPSEYSAFDLFTLATEKRAEKRSLQGQHVARRA